MGVVLTPSTAALIATTQVSHTITPAAGALAVTNRKLIAPLGAQLVASGFAGVISRVVPRRLTGLARGGDGSTAPFVEFYHAAGEILSYGIDWTYWLTRLWPKATQVSQGLTIRPTVPIGMQLVCTAAGVTQSIEPEWPAILGATVLDGSAQWTTEAVDASSLSATVVTAIWSTTGLLELANQVLVGQIAYVLVDATDAIPGNDYDVLCTVNLTSGPPNTGRLRIKVR